MNINSANLAEGGEKQKQWSSTMCFINFDGKATAVDQGFGMFKQLLKRGMCMLQDKLKKIYKNLKLVYIFDLKINYTYGSRVFFALDCL